MADASVDVPKIGKVNKKWVWGTVAVVGTYVAWRWYSANSSGSDTTPSTSDVGDSLPTGGAGGSASGNTQYAGSSTDSTSSDSIDTNAEWTQKAVELLSDAGYNPANVYAALGDFLSKAPLTTSEQAIVRAALAAVGNPPVGGPYPIREQVGSSTLKAPVSLRKWKDPTTTQVAIRWDPVPGAMYYRIFREGNPEPIGASTDSTAYVSVGRPNTAITVQVAAMSTLNKQGPKSRSLTLKTSAAKLTAPKGLKAAAGKGSVTLHWDKVPGAEGYRIYRRGTSNNVGSANGTSFTFNGLRSHSTNYWAVAAVSGSTVGPRSGWVKSTTK